MHPALLSNKLADDLERTLCWLEIVEVSPSSSQLLNLGVSLSVNLMSFSPNSSQNRSPYDEPSSDDGSLRRSVYSVSMNFSTISELPSSAFELS